MLSKKKKVVVSAIIAGALALVPMAAFAASYSVSYNFKYQVKGKDNNQTYAMSAGTIKVDIDSSTDYLVGQPQTYSQTLMKLGTFSDTAIGTIQVPINGSDSNQWTNLNAGTYYLYLQKTNDGAFTTGTGTISN